MHTDHLRICENADSESVVSSEAQDVSFVTSSQEMLPVPGAYFEFQGTF